MIQLTKEDWQFIICGTTAVTTPIFVGAPVQDYLYIMPPVALIAYLLMNEWMRFDKDMIQQLNDGIKTAQNSPTTFLATWALFTAAIGFGVDYLLEFIEPVLDVFEILLPDGYEISWLLSPFSPTYFSFMALGTLLISILEIGILSYTIDAAYYAIGTFFPGLGFTIPMVKGHKFFDAAAMTGGRKDMGGSEKGYGISHIFRDFFQMCFAVPLVVIDTVANFVESWHHNGIKSANWLSLFQIPGNAELYMFHRLGDLILDFCFLTEDASAFPCLHGWFSPGPPNFYSDKPETIQKKLQLTCKADIH